MPRPTPEERDGTSAEIELDEELASYAERLEDWVAPRQAWEVTLREGHDFGRPNNVEARLLFVSGEQTSSLSFRLDQVSRLDDTGEQLVVIFEEQDGIASFASCTANGLDVELFHILTYT